MSIRVKSRIDTSPPTSFLTVTTEKLGNSVIESRLGQPVIHRRQYLTNSSGTDRAFLPNLSRFINYADGFWNGATAQIYTVTNGVRTRIASATVTATKTNLIENVTPTSSGSAGKVTTTTFQWRVANFMRPSVGYWFRVAAVDGSGGVGTYSSWVQFTAPASGLGAGTASNTVSALGGSGTSGLAAPTGVAVAAKAGEPAVAEVTWDAVGSATGYLIQICYQDPAVNVTDQYIDLDTSGLTIPQGAVVILEKLSLEPSDKIASRVWNDGNTLGGFVPSAGFRDSGFSPAAFVSATHSRWISHGGSPPDGVDGEYFWRRTMSGPGEVAEGYFHTGPGGNYTILVPNNDYKIRFRMKASSSVTATFTMGSVTVGGSTTFNLTTSWQTFTHTFSRSTTQTGTTPHKWSLTVPSAVTVDIATLDAWNDTLDPDDWAPDEKPRASAGIFLRDHTLIKPGPKTGTIRQFCNRTGQVPRGNSLYTLFRRCQLNDMLPWIQIEWHCPPEDWPDLVAYMAAPVGSGHPMATLRANQGQTAPWIDEFSGIILEIGNEAWNTLSEFWQTFDTQFKDQATSLNIGSGPSFGAHVEGCIKALETSPYYTAFRAKTILYGSGREGSTNAFGVAAISTAPSLDGTGPAGYNGGWESGQPAPTETGNSFNVLLRDSNKTTVAHWAAYTSGMENLGKFVGAYESGPGYPFPGTTTAAQVVLAEVFYKSRAGGTATLTSFCLRAAAGFRFDNFFRLSSGNLWTSHAVAGEGGGTFPAYGLLKLIWDAVGPCRVEKLNFTTTPTSKDGHEMMQAFRFKSVNTPGTSVIVVVNRDIDPSLLEVGDPLYSATPGGRYLMTVRTGIESCTGLQYYANAGNFREHNRYPVGFRQNPATGAYDVADPLCVEISYDWTTGTPLTNALQITINNTYGAESDGLRAGNCVLIKMTGCQP
jgi:hypothetical protein